MPPPNQPLPQPGVLNFLGWAARNEVAASPDLQRAGDTLSRLAQHHRSRRHRPTQPAQPPPPAATPSPYAAPGVWDTLVIAGVTFMGLVKPSGDVGVDLDVAKHSGHDGGTIRDKGFRLAKLKITLRMWDEEGWASWDGLLPSIDPRRQVGRRTPVDIVHPALAQRGIGRVYIETIGLPDVQESGEIHVSMNVYEFHPPSRGRQRTRRATIVIGDNATAFTGLNLPAATAPSPPSETRATDP